jgi:pyrroline-5-carboxylate reductase
MLTNKTLTFIGPGVMAEAMIAGLIRQEMTLPVALIAAGPRQDRLDELQQRYGMQTSLDNAEAARQADIVILSVKPQRLNRVLSGLKDQIRPDALVLSIVAGAPIAKIAIGLNHPVIVRSMPNTPAQIGEGTASPEALAFFESRSPTYRKTAKRWVMSAKKEETRDRRMAELVADSEAEQLIKPLRYGRNKPAS